MISIEKVSNGYVATKSNPPVTKFIFKTTDELFDWLLLQLEGKSKTFFEDLYGKVTIERGEK